MTTGPSMSTRSAVRLHERLRLLFLWAVSIGATLNAQDSPRLQAVLNAEKTLIRLELQGRAGINHEIEASNDLKLWTPVASGQLGNGILLNEQALSGHHRFFRGRELSGSTNNPTISVTPLADTNLSVSFMVTTDGGSGVLYSSGGTQLKFTLPPLTVLDAAVVTMTLVTNVGGLPFSQGILGAVRLEPDGFALWGAGTLEISLPSGLDLRKIASFAAHGNGSSFQITPDRVKTNTVLIPVTRLGLVGSALALDTELHSTATPRALTSQNTFHAQSAGSAGCFPEREAAAQFWDTHFTQESARYAQRLASALVRARRAQSAGDRGDTFDPSAVEQAEVDFCSTIGDLTGPVATEAAGNCALATVMVRHLRRIDRQRQFLGLPTEDPRCPVRLDEQNLCPMFKNCIQEIKDCCERGIKGRQQIEAIYRNLSYDRNSGNACLTAAEIEEAVDACAPGKWTGTLTLKIDGRALQETHPAPGQTRTELQTSFELFLGNITRSSESASSQGTNVILTLEGQAIKKFEETRIFTAEGDCGGTFTHDYRGNFAHGPTEYTVFLTMNPGESPFVSIFPTAANPTFTGQETTHSYKQIGVRVDEDECFLRATSDGQNEDWQAGPMGTLFTKPATFQNNQLTGGGDMDLFQLLLPGTGRFEWRFVRHPERP